MKAETQLLVLMVIFSNKKTPCFCKAGSGSTLRKKVGSRFAENECGFTDPVRNKNVPTGTCFVLQGRARGAHRHGDRDHTLRLHPPVHHAQILEDQTLLSQVGVHHAQILEDQTLLSQVGVHHAQILEDQTLLS